MRDRNQIENEISKTILKVVSILPKQSILVNVTFCEVFLGFIFGLRCGLASLEWLCSSFPLLDSSFLSAFVVDITVGPSKALMEKLKYTIH
jgi:hypothetical protein